MPETLRIEALSDAQLLYIRGLCDEYGVEPPGAVYSKSEASEIIGAITHRQYDPSDFAAPSGARTADDAFYVCPRCAGTPADPLYVDDEPREPLPEREPDEVQP